MQSAREVAIKSVCTDTHTIQVHWHATAAFSPPKDVRTYQLSNFMSSSGFFVFCSAFSLIACGYNFKTLSNCFASASRKKVDVSFAVAIVNVLNVQHCALRTYLVSYSAELDAAAAPGRLGALSPLAAILPLADRASLWRSINHTRTSTLFYTLFFVYI